MTRTLFPVANPKLGEGIDRWLVLCAVVGLAFWLFALLMESDARRSGVVADLAIGRGMPLLSAELPLAVNGVSFIDDVDDVRTAVHQGLANVGVDAGPDGVQIVYRPDARGAIPPAASQLARAWDTVQPLALSDFRDPGRIAQWLLVLLVLNTVALMVVRQLRRLQAGHWMRWLALQGAVTPELLVRILAAYAGRAALLAMFAYIGWLGPGAIADVLLAVLLLSVSAVSFGLLLAVAGRAWVPLWLGVHAALLLGFWVSASVSAVALPAAVGSQGPVTGVLLTILSILLLAGLLLRHRLAGWASGDTG